MSERRGRPRGRRAPRERILLYAALGVAAAFVVSLVAALLGDGAGVAAPSAANPALDGPRVRVEVLNGAGTAGAARRATEKLRGLGFDVVFYGNADAFGRERSVVLDRSGRPDRAEAVARALGIDSVRAAPDPGLALDATVVLGREWQVEAGKGR